MPDTVIASEGLPVPILALMDATLRPLMLVVLVACVLVAVAIARDVLTTAYPDHLED